jgi:5-formaminoimidazole-4-carboxamide-1-beta-D-ribofuranosyl 5'-monophosphate synthetase
MGKREGRTSTESIYIVVFNLNVRIVHDANIFRRKNAYASTALLEDAGMHIGRAFQNVG